MTEAVDGQVDKVVRIIASSDQSWEHAARAAVNEAALTINDLRNARVMKKDIVVRDGVFHFRVKLEMAFQLDRGRRDASGVTVQVKRYLIVANRTLCGPQLEAMVKDRIEDSPAEFHVLVPQTPTPTLHADPSGMIDPSLQESVVRGRMIARQQAEARLGTFRTMFSQLGRDLTGEIAVGDPVVAARRVLERSSFDEIIVSTLPPGLSRWLKLDLPNRLTRAFSVPVVSIVQRELADAEG